MRFSGDVLRDARDADEPSVVVTDGEGLVVHPADGAVGTHDAVLLVVLAARLPLERSPDVRAIVRMDRVEPPGGVLEQALARLAPDRLVPRADVDDAPLVDVREPEDLLDALGELLEASAALLEVALGLAPRRHVLVDGDGVRNAFEHEAARGDLADSQRAVTTPDHVLRRLEAAVLEESRELGAVVLERIRLQHARRLADDVLASVAVQREPGVVGVDDDPLGQAHQRLRGRALVEDEAEALLGGPERLRDRGHLDGRSLLRGNVLDRGDVVEGLTTRIAHTDDADEDVDARPVLAP